MNTYSRVIGIIAIIVFGLLIFFYLIIRLTKPQIKLVSGFPEIPVFPGAYLVYSSKEPREGLLFEATWEVVSAISAISNWYVEKLQEEGWDLDITPADATSDIQLMRFYNDIYTLNLSVIRESGSAKARITAEFLKNLKLQEVKNPDPEGFIPKIP